jgi:hypothetical protein
MSRQRRFLNDPRSGACAGLGAVRGRGYSRRGYATPAEHPADRP